MKYELIGSLLIFIIIIFPLPAYGQNTTLNCGIGLIEDKSTGQCVLNCGEGTIPNGPNGCIEDSSVDFGQIEAIAVGIIGGLIATAFGIAWTVKTRKEERRKEDLEIIQNYGSQLSEIIQEEKNLETKLDCSLYGERYLDTLDQIASLLYKKLIRREVADYFENHFKYGMNLWYWYKQNVEQIPENLLEEEFSKGLKDPYQWRKDTKYQVAWNHYYKEIEESEEDRWYYFRWWCYFEENVENV